MDWLASLGDTWLNTLGWVAGLTLAFGVLARLMPCNPGMYWWNDRRAAGTDFLYWFIVPVFLRLCRTALLAGGITLLFGGREPAFLPVKDLPVWLQAVLILLLQDVYLYWMHRIFHTRLAWAFHAVHHSPTTLDWTASSRFHPVNNLLEFALADVLVLMLGFSPEALIVLVPFNILYSAMVHANLNWTFGPLRYVFASPVFHRWHHTTQEEGLDKNFASTFPFLDLLFGTFHMPPGKLPQRFGVGDSDFPEDFWGQLVHPFWKRQPTPGVRPAWHWWRPVVGAVTVLMVLGGVVFAIVRGQSEKQRDRHFDQAQQLFNAREYQRAIAEYTEALGYDPASALLYADRASAYFNLGDLEQAIADCNRALELDPQLPIAYANRGGAYLNRGDHERAIEDCTRAIELDPQMSLAYANRGGACLNKGDLDGAIADCSQALALDASQTTAYLNRAIALRAKGDNDRSIQDCDAALRLNPHLTIAYTNRATARFNKGEDRQAIDDWNEVVQRDPNPAFAYVNRGAAYARLGESTRALQDFTRAIELNPNLAVAYVYRGSIFLGMDDSDKAIADCSQAVRIDPHLAFAYWQRGMAYDRKGDRLRAQADQKKAHELEASLGQP
jgi:sterol desaturase/sphingolipid hydroxylase (fatty acid hydroxylase superfamily)/tetratricopeptide (TPR) repeat protein